MKGALLFLKAQTSVHAGTGAGIGAIDLPIQRERHTGWPMFQATGVKGVLRAALRRQRAEEMRDGGDTPRWEELLKAADHDLDVVKVFGSPAKQAEAAEGDGAGAQANQSTGQQAEGAEGNGAGARANQSTGQPLSEGNLVVTDARILLFPVRSAKEGFAWVTCPSVLQRLKYDLEMCRASLGIEWTGAPAAGHAWCAGKDLVVTPNNDGRIVVEEFVLTPSVQKEDGDLCPALAGWLAMRVPKTDADELRKRLVVVDDDTFTYLTRYCVEIITRVALDPSQKVVVKGFLFNQEMLPPESVMYSVLLPLADGVLNLVQTSVQASPVLQIGGDETTGKGLCWAGMAVCEDAAKQ